MLRCLKTLLIRVFNCTVLLVLLWLLGYVWFVMQVPTRTAQDVARTDAIVVLTGGSGRIDYGLKLLAQGKGSRLFITGVESRLSPDKLVARYKPALAELGRDTENNAAVIKLGYDARNTIGNAMETAQWMRREHLKSIRLVTANYHMPRALGEFRYAMPDILIIPDPALPEDFDIDRWWTLDASSKLLLSEYHKFMAATLRHWLISAAEEN